MKVVSYHEAAQDELLGEIAYEEIRLGIRKRVLRKFPYSLIYSLETEGPLILAVAHHSRRPGYWVRRVSGGHGFKGGA